MSTSDNEIQADSLYLFRMRDKDFITNKYQIKHLELQQQLINPLTYRLLYALSKPYNIKLKEKEKIDYINTLDYYLNDIRFYIFLTIALVFSVKHMNKLNNPQGIIIRNSLKTSKLNHIK